MLNETKITEFHDLRSCSMVRCRLSRQRHRTENTRSRSRELVALHAFCDSAPGLSGNLSSRLELDRGAYLRRAVSRANVRHHGHLSSLLFASDIQDLPFGAICLRDGGRIIRPAGSALVGGEPSLAQPGLGHTFRALLAALVQCA